MHQLSVWKGFQWHTWFTDLKKNWLKGLPALSCMVVQKVNFGLRKGNCKNTSLVKNTRVTLSLKWLKTNLMLNLRKKENMVCGERSRWVLWRSHLFSNQRAEWWKEDYKTLKTWSWDFRKIIDESPTNYQTTFTGVQTTSGYAACLLYICCLFLFMLFEFYTLRVIFDLTLYILFWINTLLNRVTIKLSFASIKLHSLKSVFELCCTVHVCFG